MVTVWQIASGINLLVKHCIHHPLLFDAFCNYSDTSSTNFQDPLTYEDRIRVHNNEELQLPFVLRWPLGPRLLEFLCTLTHLGPNLQVPSTTGLFISANLRQCSDARAPAIMSALGVTAWYGTGHALPRREPIVLETYPLSFVREAVSKLGAAFFESYNWDSKGRSLPSLLPILNRGPFGSMMPFSKPNAWHTGVTGTPGYTRMNPQDHPAVKAWEIAADASVRITKAGILAAQGRPCDGTIRVTLMTNEFHKGTNLNDWLQRISESIYTFVVMLYQDRGQQHGTILQGKRRQLVQKAFS